MIRFCLLWNALFGYAVTLYYLKIYLENGHETGRYYWFHALYPSSSPFWYSKKMWTHPAWKLIFREINGTLYNSFRKSKIIRNIKTDCSILHGLIYVYIIDSYAFYWQRTSMTWYRLRNQFHLLGSTYNIPIQILFLSSHPVNAPLVFVKPTNNMLIKPNKHVDNSGRVYMPYLSEWKAVCVYHENNLFSIVV